MDVRKESHVAAALKYIEENLPVGEEGLYGLVNNAGVVSIGFVVEADYTTPGTR